MLKLAIEAGLPLISVQTRDPTNVGGVLSEIVGEDRPIIILTWNTVLMLPVPPKGIIQYTEQNFEWNEVYAMYQNNKSTLIVINQKSHPTFFETGELSVPESLIRKFVQAYTTDNVDEVVRCFKGNTLKEVSEISQLAMTEYGEFTPKSVQAIKRRYMGQIPGLREVDTSTFFYDPQKDIDKWLAKEGKLLLTNAPRVLKPRGILLEGSPGTGKTQAAKYIARETGLALFLVEIGILMDRYVGESEKRLTEALRRAESMAPCIVLFDEVEKLFQGGTDSGVTSRLLSMLLWWLQEHTADVLTIMTSNHPDQIPPELVRKGRIDTIIHFDLLSRQQARQFFVVMNEYMINNGIMKLGYPNLTALPNAQYSHAEASAILVDLAKGEYLNGS
ncbi:MAG: AAA family ATPase [Nitrosopumilus sp.]